MKKNNTKFINEASEEIYQQTYKFQGDESSKGDADINETHLRVAKDLAKYEANQETVNDFLTILEDFAFMPGGRITSNAGIGLKGTTYINCFVDGFIGDHQDSMEGILDTLRRQALILKSEGGYGFNSDVMRPRGAYIGGIGNESPGSVDMLDMWDTQSAIITKGSGKQSKKGKIKIRKGAQMVTKSVWHPDIEEYITAKQTENRLTKFNMSILCDDDFMNAVKHNKPWSLKFPDFENCKETYNNEWDGNIKLWEKKNYPVKIYHTYEDANELWELITKSTYNRNEPGVLFVDTINRLNNLWYCEYINATNPCVTGDTLINSNKGIIRMDDVIELYKKGENISVLSYNEKDKKLEYKKVEWGDITRKNASIIEIETESGDRIKLTPDHNVFTENRGYIKSSELTEKDILLRYE